jgi:hypothetical protein
MAAIFPSSLPWFTRFVLSPAGQRAATQPPKHFAQRSSTTSGWAKAEVGWVFFEEQRATFEDWFRVNAKRGAPWVLMKLPITPGGIAGSCYSAVRFPNGYSKPLVVNGLWRVSATVEIRERFECALPYYDVDLHSEDNAGGSSAVGIAVSGLDPAKSWRVQPMSRLYTAWSRWSSDDNPTAAGLPWECSYRVTTTGGESSYLTTAYPTAAQALAAATPATLTGYASYTFWLFDNFLGDNRGGLSLRMRMVA